MSDELDHEHSSRTPSLLVADWEEGGGYRGEYDFDAERAWSKTCAPSSKSPRQP